MRNRRVLLYSMVLVIMSFHVARAQLIEFPLPRVADKQNTRIKNDTIPIDLPLWDDFSTSTTVPDTSFWVSSQSIFINPGIGINPPSINVATFDGWDVYGNLYSTDPEARGKTDSLVSRPINLGKVPVSLQNTVFLSFYYQREGNGDIPNEEDSLILQFRKPDGEWKTVWPLPGELVSTVSNFFTQKIIQVSQEYMYDGFQFKFQAYGRQSGPFDTWNLDYIFLDKRRNSNDLSYLDRAFRTVPTSIFQPYSAIPIEHFFQQPADFLQNPSVDFINLERQVQPVEYSAITTNAITGLPVDTLILDSAFLALRFPLGQVSLQAGQLEPGKLDGSADSLVLRTTFYMDSGDNFLIDSIANGGVDTIRYQTIDLRVNDTTSVISVLSDYYAYDDGTAEFGAGINQLNGRLAYMFVAQSPGFITSIDINFLNIGGQAGGIPVQLFVLDSLVNNLPITEITEATAQIGPNLDEFVTYTLSKPVAVADTFFIGYRQNTDDFLPVGLDKNTLSPGRIFINVSGTWQADTVIRGSLMMRPRFGENVVTGINYLEQDLISVYPNPTKGRVHFSSLPEKIQLFSLQGVQIPVRLVGRDEEMLDLSGLPPSVYVLRMRVKGHWFSRKILLDY